MSNDLKSFLTSAKDIAEARGLIWAVRFDSATGTIPRSDRWNLSELAGIYVKPQISLASMSTYQPALAMVEELAGDRPAPVMPDEWVELFKAVLVHDQFAKRNKPNNFAANVSPAFRILASCAGGLAPHEIGPDQVRLAFNVALRVSDSGKRGGTLKALVAQWFDSHRLADTRPLAGFCEPYSDEHSKRQADRLADLGRRQIDAKRPDRLRSKLSQRHYDERLPDEDAFWELIRIVFTEPPKTFSDAVRFHQYRILVLTGFRVGELVTMPADALRRTEHLLGRLTPLMSTSSRWTDTTAINRRP